MAGAVYPLSLNQTLDWKVRNFPDDIYSFNPLDKLRILMSILLDNPGVGQLDIVQTAARINQENLEFSDIDTILGMLLGIPRLPSELYSTSANPFTDQLLMSQWFDVIYKDSNYRQRLDSAVAARLFGATPIGIKSMAESVSHTPVKMVESWNVPIVKASGNYTVTISGFTYTTIASGTSLVSGTLSTTSGYIPYVSQGITNYAYVGYTTAETSRGLDGSEIMFYPKALPDVSWSPDFREAIITSIETLKPASIDITVANPVATTEYIQAPYRMSSTVSGVFTTSGTASVVYGNSYFFYLNRTVLANNVSTPTNITTAIVAASGQNSVVANGRYWLVNNQPSQAPFFAHTVTQEADIDVTQNISTVQVQAFGNTGVSTPTNTATGLLGQGTLSVSSTVYGAL